jgi:beta-phosphoglucomutase-like phosphatase (HAD superfamily)
MIALIFDMDGVIVDSNPVHCEAWEAFNLRYGVTTTREMHERMYGKRNDEIVRTISALARILGMDVTVEGLESAAQVERMRALGIDYAQGFYFSPPVDAARVAQTLLSVL